MTDLIESLTRHERLLGQWLNDGSMWDEEELGYLARDMAEWKVIIGQAINALTPPSEGERERLAESVTFAAKLLAARGGHHLLPETLDAAAAALRGLTISPDYRPDLPGSMSTGEIPDWADYRHPAQEAIRRAYAKGLVDGLTPPEGETPT